MGKYTEFTKVSSQLDKMVGKNAMGNDTLVIRGSETSVWASEGRPMISINQKDALANDDTKFSSVHLIKNTIIHLAAYFLAEGASHDLDYDQLAIMIDRLQKDFAR